MAVTGPFLADGVTAGSATSTKPTVTTSLTGSSGSCISAGIQDRFTVTIATPAVSAGVVTDTFRLTLSGVKYNVGATAATGRTSAVRRHIRGFGNAFCLVRGLDGSVTGEFV